MSTGDRHRLLDRATRQLRSRLPSAMRVTHNGARVLVFHGRHTASVDPWVIDESPELPYIAFEIAMTLTECDHYADQLRRLDFFGTPGL